MSAHKKDDNCSCLCSFISTSSIFDLLTFINIIFGNETSHFVGGVKG